VRDARAEDLDTLSALAFASKAHWGYDDAFMEACRPELTLVSRHLDEYVVRVAESDGEIVGFHGVERTADAPDLMWLFVVPAAIGTGVGRILLADAVVVARALGARVLRIEADPNAAAFYQREGAQRVGEAPSASIPGRTLPLFELAVT
jgi:GNAT superfamily N-acetyltransferase